MGSKVFGHWFPIRHAPRDGSVVDLLINTAVTQSIVVDTLAPLWRETMCPRVSDCYWHNGQWCRRVGAVVEVLSDARFSHFSYPPPAPLGNARQLPVDTLRRSA